MILAYQKKGSSFDGKKKFKSRSDRPKALPSKNTVKKELKSKFF